MPPEWQSGENAADPGRGTQGKNTGRAAARPHKLLNERPNGRPSSQPDRVSDHGDKRPAQSRRDRRERRKFFDNGQTGNGAWR